MRVMGLSFLAANEARQRNDSAIPQRISYRYMSGAALRVFFLILARIPGATMEAAALVIGAQTRLAGRRQPVMACATHLKLGKRLLDAAAGTGLHFKMARRRPCRQSSRRSASA